MRLFNSACMNKKITALFVLLLLLPFAANAANKKFVLVIDPGHGGKDAIRLTSLYLCIPMPYQEVGKPTEWKLTR